VNDRDVDVVVVGAGIAGASAAAEIARSSRVVVVEQESLPGQHATGRSAAVLSETSGHPLVCALARLSRPYLEEHGLLSPRGLVWVGEAGDEAALDALAAQAARVAPTSRRLTPREVKTLLPTFADGAVAGGGVHEPDAMTIDAAELLAGFLRAVRTRGGEVLTTAEAITFERGDRWIVHAGEHVIECDDVVNASGAWVDVVAARAGVAPLGMHVYRRTAAIAPTADDVRDWPLVMDVAGRWYCEPESGGLLISPADETPTDPCDARADELDVALALDRVRDATGLPLRSIRRAWAGLRTFAPDRAPVLGEDPHVARFWWLAGQGGAGIKTAPAMARLLACALAGDPFPDDALGLAVTPESLSPRRFSSAR
jgi:D-arginine dehydrogenase